MGRGIELTIDEWFYHWFGESDAVKVKLVTTFFEKLLEVCDRIVIKRGSNQARKFYELVEKSVMFPPSGRDAVKVLMANFYRFDKIVILTEVTLLAEELVKRVPRKDVYLVEACLASNEKIIVTTDGTLFQNLIDTYPELGIRVFMAEDFIQQYPHFI
jgi:hypothetical protein